MGLSSSIPETLTLEQEDVKYLGERMPFGDEELLHVYRAYQGMHENEVGAAVFEEVELGVDEGQQQEQDQQQSFVVDIGMATVVDPDSRATRRKALQFADEKLLAPGFGNRWYQVAFLPPPLVKMIQDGSGVRGSTSQQQPESDRTGTPSERATLEAFFDGLSNCTRRGYDKALRVLFDCCQAVPQIQENKPLSATTTSTSSPFSDFAYGSNAAVSSPFSSQPLIDPMEFVTISYRVGLAANYLSLTLSDEDEGDVDSTHFSLENEHGLYPEIHAGVKALSASLVDYCNKRKQRLFHTIEPTTTHVSWEEVKEWAENSAPMLGAALATLTHVLFFPNTPPPPTRSSFDFPNLGGFTSALISNPSCSSLLFNLACMSPSLGGEYYRLYTSASDGLSFNRLQNALLGYGGPTLILIQSGTCLFGAFTASPWKESKDFYGDHNCFLYQLLPSTAVYHPSGKENHFMYCNGFARSRGYDQQAHGIGFGGTTDQPRLFLAESFDNCRAAAQDLTFESGRLLDHNGTNFEIDNLEVWGVGGTQVVEEALGARSLQRDIKNAAIQKARKVDKAQFLDDFRSGMMESKAFHHQQQVQGREGCEVGDEDLKR